MAMNKSLTVAYTPDPDDAFHYCALETARVPWPEGVTATFEHLHIKALNESCRFGRFDVCAISSVFYPQIDDSYVILGSGASVGRDYGPVLGCREDDALESLVGKRVAVPGTSTTGYFLLSYFYKSFTAVPMAFDQLVVVRAVQDRTAGFSAFIPWSFKPGNSALGKKIKVAAHPMQYLRLLAVARLMLDNVPHVQSSWFSEDLRTGQLGLLAGADDFGGLLFEESVLGKAGHAPKTSLVCTLEVIRAMGFEPAQRNSFYEVIARYDQDVAA